MKWISDCPIAQYKHTPTHGPTRFLKSAVSSLVKTENLRNAEPRSGSSLYTQFSPNFSRAWVYCSSFSTWAGNTHTYTHKQTHTYRSALTENGNQPEQSYQCNDDGTRNKGGGRRCKNTRDVKDTCFPIMSQLFICQTHTHTHRQVYSWSRISSCLRRRDIHHVIKGESWKVTESPAADSLTSDKSNLNPQITTDAITESDDKVPETTSK